MKCRHCANQATCTRRDIEGKNIPLCHRLECLEAEWDREGQIEDKRENKS